MRRLNAVVDSTVLVSAFIRKGGVNALLLRHGARGVFELFLSHAIIDETQNTLLEREHIRERYRYTDQEVEEFCQSLQSSFPSVTDIPALTGISRDPHDDMVVACAVAAQTSYLVSRDNDLLSLSEYENIKIVTPEAFMGILREQGLI